MSKQVQNFIDDARRFQRCSDHDLAISSLQLAQQEDHHKEHEIEIQKLFSLSYRKIGNYNMALLCTALHLSTVQRTAIALGLTVLIMFIYTFFHSRVQFGMKSSQIFRQRL